MLRNLFLTTAAIVFCVVFGSAQAIADREDNQSWNDLQLTVAMSKRVDFTLQWTERFGGNFTQSSDHRFGIGFVVKPHPSWFIQPFFLYVDARNSRGQFRTEHRLNLRFGYRFPFKKFGLSSRSTVEWRRRAPQNSWRFRPSLTFEKDIAKFIPKTKFYITEEVIYDSLLKQFSRNRLTIGINRTLTRKLSLDVYYMRQNDGFSLPGDLNVLGTSWRLRL